MLERDFDRLTIDFFVMFINRYSSSDLIVRSFF